MVDVDGRAELPIACTLGPSDGAARIGEWQKLIATRRVATSRHAGRTEMRFPADDETARELERLVAAERDCCSFVDWSMTADADQLVLTISGDEAALESFSF